MLSNRLALTRALISQGEFLKFTHDVTHCFRQGLVCIVITYHVSEILLSKAREALFSAREKRTWEDLT